MIAYLEEVDLGLINQETPTFQYPHALNSKTLCPFTIFEVVSFVLITEIVIRNLNICDEYLKGKIKRLLNVY